MAAEVDVEAPSVAPQERWWTPVVGILGGLTIVVLWVLVLTRLQGWQIWSVITALVATVVIVRFWPTKITYGALAALWLLRLLTIETAGGPGVAVAVMIGATVAFTLLVPEGSRYLALASLSLVVLTPIYFLVVRAVSDPTSAFTESIRVPINPSLDGFRTAWDRGNLDAALIRSLVVTVCITVAQVTTSVLAAYAFAFLTFPLKRLTFAVFMATLLLPLEVTLLPNLQTMRDLGWFDSYQGLIVPFGAAAFGTFLVRQGFLGIPPEIRDAARLEGWSHLQFLFRFAVPLTRPVIASFTVIAFLGAYNQYLWPRAITIDTENWGTVQLALRGLTTSIEQSNVPVAGAVIAALPILILLILFQRQIVRGLTAGAVKG